jgi:hypothetical protein
VPRREIPHSSGTLEVLAVGVKGQGWGEVEVGGCRRGLRWVAWSGKCGTAIPEILVICWMLVWRLALWREMSGVSGTPYATGMTTRAVVPLPGALS